MPKRKVSIVLATYNSLEALKKAVESVLNQTYKNIELIIVDDGSTDKTPEYLNQFKRDPKVKVFRQENMGANHARNRGAELASGDFLLFTDDRVILFPDLVEKQLVALENEGEASYAYCDFKVRVKEGSWRNPLFKSRPFDPSILKISNYVSVVSLIRREHFPGFDQDIKCYGDWDLWLTMLDNGYIGVYVPKVLFETIDVEDSATNRLIQNHYVEESTIVYAKHRRIAIITINKAGLKSITKTLKSLERQKRVLYDHYVVALGAENETINYLNGIAKNKESFKALYITDKGGNTAAGYNQALESIVNSKIDYSYVLTLSEGSEFTADKMLYEMAKIMIFANDVFLLSPYFEGFKPPIPAFAQLYLYGYNLELTPHLEPICRMAPFEVFKKFRYSVELPSDSKILEMSLIREAKNMGYYLAYAKDLKMRFKKS